VAATKSNKQSIAAASQLVEPLLTEAEVADICGLSTAAIRRWRLLNQGPRYIKVGAAVRYRLEDIRGWLATRPSGGELTPEAGQ
jgi:predicted DNA-binding transcriptional regulator AlpA